MAENLSANFIAWKNQEGRQDPLVTLYDVEINDSTTLYLVAGDPLGTGTVDFNGNTYTATAIEQEDYAQNIEGELPSFRIAVSNIDGQAAAYIEQNDLRGRPVTITQALSTTLLVADSISESYTIQDQAYDRRQASFVLSHANFFRRKVGTRKYERWKCRWLYAERHVTGSGCGYPRDEFQADTQQDFIVGGRNSPTGNTIRKHGWWAINALNARVWNVNIERLGACHISSEADNFEWGVGERSGHFMYKDIEGDFDVITLVILEDSFVGVVAGLLVQDAATATSWALLGLREDADGVITPEVTSAVADVAQPLDVATGTDSSDIYLRMTRSGNDFEAFYADSPVGAWTSFWTATFAGFDARANLGLVLASAGLDTGRASVTFDFIRFQSGGLSTCDLSLDGANGCRAHNNVHRFMAFRGIPRIR